jgi:uncharacterized protein (DUF2062 family)
LRALALRLRSAIEALTNEEAALILVVGLVLGTFPMVGLPTLLCALAAAALRLHFPTLQIVNNLSSPLQIALLFPCARLGSWILGSQATSKWGGVAIEAVAGWFCITVPAGVVLYLALVYALRKLRPGCFNGLESPA